MNALQIIAQAIATIAGTLAPAMSIEQAVVAIWHDMKGTVTPVLDPTGTVDPAELQAQVTAAALEAHAAWHQGDDPAPVPVEQPAPPVTGDGGSADAKE